MKTIALLRGINVGGNRKVPMADLREVFESAGCTQVATYIQSGNVIFAPPTKRAKNLHERLEAAIAERFGFPVPLVLRDGNELSAIATRNPFLKRGSEADRLHVGFLRDPPRLSGPLTFPLGPGEAVEHIGQDIFLHLPAGVAKTKLTNTLFDRTFQTICTVRNWRTVLALRDMAAET